MSFLTGPAPKSSKCWGWQNPNQKSESGPIKQQVQQFFYTLELVPPKGSETSQKRHPVYPHCSLNLWVIKWKLPPLKTIPKNITHGKYNPFINVENFMVMVIDGVDLIDLGHHPYWLWKGTTIKTRPRNPKHVGPLKVTLFKGKEYYPIPMDPWRGMAGSGDNDRRWETMRKYAKGWETMNNYEKLWETMRNFEKRSEMLRNHEKTWEIDEKHWKTMRNGEKWSKRWETMRSDEKQRETMGNNETQWETMRHNAKRWETIRNN